MISSRTNIVVGIVYNKQRDRILLCLRPSGSEQGGLWEFPGGKVEPDESLVEALSRELFEEVGVHVQSAHPLLQLDHDYPDNSIRLNAWIVDRWSGEVHGKQGQPVEWVLLNEIDSRPSPAANSRITQAISLPMLYLITPDLASYDDSFLQLTETMIRNGLALLSFRSRRSGFNQHKGFVRELVKVCNKGACRLIYNGIAEHAIAVGAHGVHLQSRDLMQLTGRPLPVEMLVAASCHDRRELVHACRIGADFCVISAVHQTSTHPGVKGTGWKQFSRLSGRSSIPVYALGGIRPEELSVANRSGAHGIAMISGVWDDPDAAGIIARFNHSLTC